MNLRRILVSLAVLVAAIVTALAGAVPASAGTVTPAGIRVYSCVTNGHIGDWHAYGYRDGTRVWTGPERVLRSTAVRDCSSWLGQNHNAGVTGAFVLTPAVGPSILQNNGRSCAVVGHAGAWHAAKYLDGDYYGSGPRRFWKATATGDCREFVFGF